MDNKKFEQLIDLIINENEEQAKALFHDIVVEKSREIYESMMDEEQMMNQPSGQVQDLLDEIGSEEQGMAEAEDEEFDIADMDDGEGDEESVDIEMDSEEGGEESREKSSQEASCEKGCQESSEEGHQEGRKKSN